MDLKSEGLMVAGCAGAAYLFAFAYELGLMSVWSIPLEYLSINLSTFLIVASAFLLTFIPLFFCWLILAHSRFGRRPIYTWMLMIAAFLVLCPTIILVFRYQWNTQLWHIIVLGALGLVVFLSVFVIRGNVTEYSRLSGVSMVSICLLVLCFGVVTLYFLGRERAEWQTEFLVPRSDPNTVVLRNYGGNLICAPFDRKRNRIQKGFVILKSKNVERLELNWEKVGRLKMEDECKVGGN